MLGRRSSSVGLLDQGGRRRTASSASSSSILDWGFWLFCPVGLAGVGWYYLAWGVERYLVTTRRVIEAGGVINK